MSERTDLRKRENTRARLLEAGGEVIIDKGIAGTRIDDVVKAAGFTRGAFYSNFSSMDEFVREVLRVRSREVFVEVSRIFDELADPPELDSIIEAVDAIRPLGRPIYILASEYRLYRMRNPGTEPLERFAHGAPTVFVSELVEKVLARMNRRALLPPQAIGEVLSIFFMDSLSGDRQIEAVGSSAQLMGDVIRAMVLGFSVPEGEEDTEIARQLSLHLGEQLLSREPPQATVPPQG